MPKKEKVSRDAEPEPIPVSGSSNVFSKLFGQTPQSDASCSSLFSDHNPFRRTLHMDPSPAIRGSGSSDLADKSPKNLESDETHNDVELKEEKKKRKNKGTKRSQDGTDYIDAETDLGVHSDGKKTKKKKKEIDPASDVTVEKDQSGEKAEEVDLPSGPKPSSNLDNARAGKKDKKRKRDELEKEYEARKFGTPASEKQLNDNKSDKLAGQKRKTVEDPLALTVSREGYDDENKLLRTIFVGNLPLKVKKKALLREFNQFGEIESLRIRSVPTVDGKKPKKVMIFNNKLNEAADSVHAYIVFKTEQSAEASLSHNMAVVGGNHIRVDRACPPRKKLKGDDSAPLYDVKRTLFVGNLPFDVKDEELYRLFSVTSQVGADLEAVRVIRDSNTSLGKGIAYVLFKTRDAANLVVRRKNLKLRDRELRICHASSKSTPAKRKNLQSGDDRENYSPGKKFATEPKTPDNNSITDKPKRKSMAPASYEGFRATKSGPEKKPRHQKFTKPAAFKSPSESHLKQRLEKRPAVAARKAGAKGLNRAGGGGSFSKQLGGDGKKRKMGNRTPQSSNQKNKRARKS